MHRLSAELRQMGRQMRCVWTPPAGWRIAWALSLALASLAGALAGARVVRTTSREPSRPTLTPSGGTTVPSLETETRSVEPAVAEPVAVLDSGRAVEGLGDEEAADKEVWPHGERTRYARIGVSLDPEPDVRERIGPNASAPASSAGSGVEAASVSEMMASSSESAVTPAEPGRSGWTGRRRARRASAGGQNAVAALPAARAVNWLLLVRVDGGRATAYDLDTGLPPRDLSGAWASPGCGGMARLDLSQPGGGASSIRGFGSAAGGDGWELMVPAHACALATSRFTPPRRARAPSEAALATGGFPGARVAESAARGGALWGTFREPGGRMGAFTLEAGGALGWAELAPRGEAVRLVGVFRSGLGRTEGWFVRVTSDDDPLGVISVRRDGDGWIVSALPLGG